MTVSLSFLALIIVVALVCSQIATPLFETTFLVILGTPLLWFLCGKLALFLNIGPIYSVPLYVLCFGILVAALYYIAGIRKNIPKTEEYSPFVVFVSIFLFTFYYSSTWPDFIAMGERLRDYSILASSIHSPIVPMEPWMSGAVLNYYVYWYRFGHFLSKMLSLEVWEVYPLMTAFAMALFGAAIFEVSRKILGVSIFIAAIASVVATIGSNVAGIDLAWHDDHNWWGPSRVVRGAINEFPAWSFILGDLHPHFLNLGLLPLLLLVVYSCLQSRSNRSLTHLTTFFTVLVGILWMFAANAWEVPLWVGVLGCVTTVGAVLNLTGLKRWLKRFVTTSTVSDLYVAIAVVLVLILAFLLAFYFKSSLNPVLLLIGAIITLGGGAVVFPYWRRIFNYLRFTYQIGSPQVICAIALAILFCISLKLAGGHIVPEGGQLRRVMSPIPLTRTSELFSHWGIPLSFIAIGSILLLPRISEKFTASVLLLATLLVDDGVVFLVALTGLHLARLLSVSKRSADRGLSIVFADGFLLASLLFLILPEVYFLDDAYGGENERMNTIFKVYTTTWGLITISAASVFTRGVFALSSVVREAPRLTIGIKITASVIGVVTLGASTLFFFHGARLRQPSPSIPLIDPRIEGLSEIEYRFPGSVDIIHRLREEPLVTVLEAQGNAYDYTTFVTTLAGQNAFLGWANHVNLLTKRFLIQPASEQVHVEVGRREQVTQAIYTSQECKIKKQLALKENISFIVLGAREIEKYPTSKTTDFSCFKQEIVSRQYSLLGVSDMPDANQKNTP